MLIEWLFFLLLAALAGGAGFAVAAGHRTKARVLSTGFAAVAISGVIRFRGDLAMQKLLAYLVMPTGLIWMGLAALTLALFAQGRRGFALLSFAIFAAYSLFGNVWLGVILVSALENETKPVQLAALPELDATLVLGGGAGFDDDGRAQLTDAGERVFLGARLALAGKTRYLVTSGSSIAGISHKQDLSAATMTLWTEVGVPRESIIRLPGPQNTSQEIEAFATLARERGFKRLGLLTSASHLPRALRLCRVAGVEVTPIPADRRGGRLVLHPALLVPQPSAFRLVQLGLWELAGALVGR